MENTVLKGLDFATIPVYFYNKYVYSHNQATANTWTFKYHGIVTDRKR